MKINKKFFFSVRSIVVLAYLLLIATVIVNVFYITPYYNEIEKTAFFALIVALLAVSYESIISAKKKRE